MPSIWVDSDLYKMLKEQKNRMKRKLGRDISMSHVLKAMTSVKCTIKVRKRRKRPEFEVVKIV